jgi:hypothetical protein
MAGNGDDGDDDGVDVEEGGRVLNGKRERREG